MIQFLQTSESIRVTQLQPRSMELREHGSSQVSGSSVELNGRIARAKLLFFASTVRYTSEVDPLTLYGRLRLASLWSTVHITNICRSNGILLHICTETWSRSAVKVNTRPMQGPAANMWRSIFSGESSDPKHGLEHLLCCQTDTLQILWQTEQRQLDSSGGKRQYCSPCRPVYTNNLILMTDSKRSTPFPQKLIPKARGHCL
jgi:hypothetical protein